MHFQAVFWKVSPCWTAKTRFAPQRGNGIAINRQFAEGSSVGVEVVAGQSNTVEADVMAWAEQKGTIDPLGCELFVRGGRDVAGPADTGVRSNEGDHRIGAG